MKIDKRRPSHWICLCLFGIQVVLARCLRLWLRPRRPPDVVLYGHKLNGNLLAIYRYLQSTGNPVAVPTFVTMDRHYHATLRAQGVRSVLATRPACAALLARSAAVISDHGLHAMRYLVGSRGLHFFDVWHGIPYKGFDADDFRVEQRYTETWVASPLMKTIYKQRYGFDADRVQATGYARTDRLVTREEDTDAIRHALGLDGADTGKIVLFAPTWKQDASRRSIFPFGLNEDAFFRALSDLATRTGSTFVMRAHLNSGAGPRQNWERIVQRPHAQYPDTEQLLLVSDILVCDWSSIAFDYLLLQRPTIFLDVKAPFAKGFSLGPEYRFGDIVPDMDALLTALEHYLRHPQDYTQRFGDTAARVREAVYADRADGEAARRCVQRLQHYLS